MHYAEVVGPIYRPIGFDINASELNELAYESIYASSLGQDGPCLGQVGHRPIVKFD